MTLIQRQLPSSPSRPTQIHVKTEDDAGRSAGAITQPQRRSRSPHHWRWSRRLIISLQLC